ncbi:T3SS effector HopA1 family protein [Lacinutrix jangbogonensis]|uniref:T3SS effector HopA1 family protein n=1 Tax=Lacinutrix jangbogonensis TaxID=1469557 RepID=UPI00068DC7D1|nr:T3SS effector HopA1 family protein [Lacinutrix jangbogonensis]
MIKTKLHKDIQEVLNAVEILTETSYNIKDIQRDLTQIKLKSDDGEVLQKDPKRNDLFFKEILRSDIYNQLYKFNVPDKNSFLGEVMNGNFLENLSNANNGSGTWEDNWLIVGEEFSTGKIIVKKKDIMFWVNKDEVISSNESYVNNTPCLVKIEKEIKNLNPSFYMVFGNTNKEKINKFENQLTRFYWNLTPTGAIKYIKLVTERLNEKKCCFRTKVLSNPQEYNRSDAGVLYLDTSQLSVALPIIMEIYNDLKSYLKDKTPLFSKQLARGLSFAEDPQDGNSFGISRAEIISDTLYDCFQNKILSKNEISNEICSSFLSKGINPNYPYCSQSKLDNYEILLNSIILN